MRLAGRALRSLSTMKLRSSLRAVRSLCATVAWAALSHVGLFAAQAESRGSLQGVIVDPAKRPVEYATVTLQSDREADGVRRTATDNKGEFVFEELPFGNYRLSYGPMGGETEAGPNVTLDRARSAVRLGPLVLAAAPLQLEKVEVGARREAFYNSIDRKVYNVGQDVQSAAGTASDLLQNVPSVQVDVDGNVSLRGDENVLILINGKTSAMMGRNRAAVLEQMSASTIERVEVITNPSAKYKPEGTAGIINLVLKREPRAGFSGTARGNVGNERRANGSLSLAYNTGKYTLSGMVGLRQDDRERAVEELRTRFDPIAAAPLFSEQRSLDRSRPLSRLAELGAEVQLSEQTRFGLSADYNDRELTRRASQRNVTRDASGAIARDSERIRVAPESEQDLEFTGTFEHAFDDDGHELAVELQGERSTEEEDSLFTNLQHSPALATSQDRTLVRTNEREWELSADYTRPLGEIATLEAGYSGERSETDLDLQASFLDPVTQAWRPDATRSNRFIYEGTIHAFYGTYGQKFGDFGFMAGGRVEQAQIDTNQVTLARVDRNRTTSFYPSLHLTYDLNERHQLQANYSHRVNRPDGDDLNPFPEYDDPFHLRAGNPQLEAEEIHSFEAGYQYRKDDTTYLAAVYYRQRYNGITDVTRFVDATTLLTTKENLGDSRAGGAEVGITRRIAERLALNFSGNIYRNEIDAANLGFTGRRAATAWDAKLNANWDATKSTLIQLNASYTAKRLTPQGYREPTFIANLGLRHTFASRKTALIVSVSDVFDTLRDRTRLDTPLLRQDVTRRRSPRIIYVGLSYNFGQATKREAEEPQYDTAL